MGLHTKIMIQTSKTRELFKSPENTIWHIRLSSTPNQGSNVYKNILTQQRGHLFSINFQDSKAKPIALTSKHGMVRQM